MMAPNRRYELSTEFRTPSQFFALSTTWGTCSPLTGNPNPFNKQGF